MFFEVMQMKPSRCLIYYINFRLQRPHPQLEEVLNKKDLIDMNGKGDVQVLAEFHIPTEKIEQDQTVIAKQCAYKAYHVCIFTIFLIDGSFLELICI